MVYELCWGVGVVYIRNKKKYNNFNNNLIILVKIYLSLNA